MYSVKIACLLLWISCKVIYAAPSQELLDKVNHLIVEADQTLRDIESWLYGGRSIAIYVPPEELDLVEEDLSRFGYSLTQKHNFLSDIYLAERTKRRRDKRSVLDIPSILPHRPGVVYYPMTELKLFKRSGANVPWNYIDNNEGKRQNILNDRIHSQGTLGQNVSISIVDDGITVSDWLGSTVTKDGMISSRVDPLIESTDDHGTQCASIIGARHANANCRMGIAPASQLIDTPLLALSEPIDFYMSEAMKGGDIVSCSFGPADDGKTAQKAGPLLDKAIRTRATQGRNGKGAFIVFAAGNGGGFSDDCAMDGLASHPMVTAVSLLTPSGNVPTFIEGCSSILTAVLADTNGGEMETIGSNKRCTRMSGTSGAAPALAGYIALVLSKYSNLDRRHLEHLIVESSEYNTSFTPRPEVNAAGKMYTRKFGFGLLNITRMMQLADELSLNPEPSRQETCTSFVSGLPGKTSFTFVINCDKLKSIEHVVLRMSVQVPVRGKLSIRLRSPSGTVSTLLARRPLDKSSEAFVDWPFHTVHFWGEPVSGMWTLDLDNVDKDKLEVKRILFEANGGAAENAQLTSNSKHTLLFYALVSALILVLIAFALTYVYMNFNRSLYRSSFVGVTEDSDDCAMLLDSVECE